MEWDFPRSKVGPIVAADARMMVADLNQYSEFAIDAVVGLDLLTDANGCRSIMRPN